MKSIRISFIFLLGVFLSTTLRSQENGSVGIGIENPNSNAILHLVSPGNNQGLLIPTMTGSQRTSSSFINNLSTADNGLLVFDITDKAFYFWQDTKWQILSVGNQSLQYDPTTKELKLSGGNSINLNDLAVTNWNDLQNVPADFLDGTDEVDDADADPTNEIQDLSISGNLLRITNNENASIIDLSAFASSSSQNLSFVDGVLSLSEDPDSTLVDLSNYDTDVSDDFDGQFSSLTGVPTDLADGDQVDDADADPTNEIQDLSISGNLLRITNNENASVIDLSAFASSSSQDLSFENGVLFLSGDPDSTLIDLSNYDTDVSDDFDGQFSSLTGVPADLADGDQVDDADADPTNEIQSLEFIGEVLTLSGDQSGTSLDFTGWDQNVLDDFDGQFSSLTGVPADLTDGDQVEDADADPTNELQAISTNNSPGNITLSGDKTLTMNVNDADASNTNELISTTSLRAGNILRIVESGINHDVDLSGLVDDADASATNEVITSASLQPGNILQINEASTNHSIDLSSLVNDSDADPTNEIQTLSYDYSNFYLTLSDQSTVIDLSALNNASPWSDNGTNVSFDGLYANANNFTSTPKTERLVAADFLTGKIDQVDIEDSKYLPVFIATGTSTLSFIEAGRQGQEIVLMVIGGGTLDIRGTGGNLHLSSNSHLLTSGSTIHLVYFKDLINGTGFDGWMELSKSIATR